LAAMTEGASLAHRQKPRDADGSLSGCERALGSYYHSRCPRRRYRHSAGGGAPIVCYHAGAAALWRGRRAIQRNPAGGVPPGWVPVGVMPRAPACS
jgi:hypothetical protein